MEPAVAQDEVLISFICEWPIEACLYPLGRSASPVAAPAVDSVLRPPGGFRPLPPPLPQSLLPPNMTLQEAEILAIIASTKPAAEKVPRRRLAARTPKRFWSEQEVEELCQQPLLTAARSQRISSSRLNAIAKQYGYRRWPHSRRQKLCRDLLTQKGQAEARVARYGMRQAAASLGFLHGAQRGWESEAQALRFFQVFLATDATQKGPDRYGGRVCSNGTEPASCPRAEARKK